MPIYEYECVKCGEKFELRRSIDERDAEAKCPKCGASQAKRVLSTFGTASSGITCAPRAERAADVGTHRADNERIWPRSIDRNGQSGTDQHARLRFEFVGSVLPCAALPVASAGVVGHVHGLRNLSERQFAQPLQALLLALLPFSFVPDFGRLR